MAVALLIYLIAVYGRDTVKHFRAVPMAALLVSAGCFAFGTTVYVTSLTMIGTATVSVIGASSPIFTGVLSPWITGERPSLSSWAAALMALLGVGIIAYDGLEGGKLQGILVACLVPISFAIQTLALRRYRGIDMIPAICVGGFLSFFMAGLLGFLAGTVAGGFGVSGKEMLILAIMGPLQLSIPLIFYARGARSVSAITLSLLVMLDAVMNPFWPWAFVGEIPEQSAFIGGAVVIGAVILSVMGGRLATRTVAATA
jgi:drug/metabolite transporter (DMT)-like permease